MQMPRLSSFYPPVLALLGCLGGSVALLPPVQAAAAPAVELKTMTVAPTTQASAAGFDGVVEAVRQAVGDRSIHNIEQGADITIPRRDLSEPEFAHGPGGSRELVHPGNQEWLRGDRIARPKGSGKGSGQGEGSPDAQGDDDFTFRITREEFMNYFFDDLALPRMIRTQLLA